MSAKALMISNQAGIANICLMAADKLDRQLTAITELADAVNYIQCWHGGWNAEKASAILNSMKANIAGQSRKISDEPD